MKKKRKAELADEMLSPASSRSGSLAARGPPPNPYNNNANNDGYAADEVDGIGLGNNNPNANAEG